MTDRLLDLANLFERVEALGDLVVRDDLRACVLELDAVGRDRRLEIATAANDVAMVQLCAVVSDYGAALTLVAVDQIRRRRRYAAEGAS